MCICEVRSGDDLGWSSEEFSLVHEFQREYGDFCFRVCRIQCRACGRIFEVEEDTTPAHRVIHHWSPGA